MNPPPFLIVADRGRLKAYQVERTLAGSSMPRLIVAREYQEPLQCFGEKFTDQAGAFPNGGSAGQGNSIAERMPLMAEGEMRAFRTITAEITALLREHRPARWGFAAPSEINGAILDGLDPDLHERLAENVPRDLVNIPADELLGHFVKGAP